MAGAPSETSIANAALTLLGERRIDSLDGKSNTAKTMSERFSEVRDEVLRAHSWNFATKRTSLAVDASAPTWGYDHSFTLPEDCLRVLDVNDLGWSSFGATTGARWRYRDGWKIEGRKIVTNIDPPLQIEYTSRVTDPVQMDSMFRQVLAAALASDVAEAITGSTQKAEDVEAIYRRKLSAAKATDGQEPSPQRLEASELLDAREPQDYERTVPTGSGTPL